MFRCVPFGYFFFKTHYVSFFAVCFVDASSLVNPKTLVFAITPLTYVGLIFIFTFVFSFFCAVVLHRPTTTTRAWENSC